MLREMKSSSCQIRFAVTKSHICFECPLIGRYYLKTLARIVIRIYGQRVEMCFILTVNTVA